MNTKILLLASAAAFALASCSQNKTETTETATTPTGAEVTTTTTTTVDTASYRSTADDLANRVAADLKSTDAAVKTKLQHVYYTRGRVLRDIEARTDTAGRYAAIRAANDQASRDVKAVVTAPEYTTYTTNEAGYYGGPYTVTTTTTATPEHHASLGTRVGQGSGVKKMENTDDDHKVKYENGAKIKRSDDGSVKIKRADGTKIKIDEDGHRTVKKGLF